MELLQGISLERNRAQVGRQLEVLIEGEVEEAGGAPYGAIGRSYRDAPEVDGLVFVRERVAPGQLVSVDVTGAMAYDLVGQLSRATSQPTASATPPTASATIAVR
jgi:ribosomal protein S12 methylthiotransferase